MSYLLVIIALAVLFITGISVFLGHQIKASPRILVLHGLTTSRFDISGITPHHFEELLRCVDDSGLTLATPADSLRDHTKVAITFDDGYDDLMTLVPLLRQRSIPITVFIPTAYIGKRNDWDHFLAKGRRRHLDEQQVRELSRLGVQFGSHGHSHRDLTSISETEVRNELELSMKIITDLTSQDAIELAFPFGRTNRRIRRIATGLGMVLQFGSSVHPIEENVVGRIPISRLDNSISLRGKLVRGYIAGIEALKSVIVSRFSHLTPIVRGRSRVS